VSDPGLSAAQDVVGVFDESYNQLFVLARPLRALIRDGSKLMKHPIETGGTIADHRVFEPVGIELSLILDPAEYQNTYQEIKSAYTGNSKLTVQTRVDTYTDMVILEMPHDETADIADTIAMGIKLEHAIFVDPQYAQLPPSKVKKSSNSSTAKTGQKQGTDANASQNSAAYDLIFGSGK
jgi:hypothetical protein